MYKRQSIARAIARKPEILLFDDAFSALDYKTDRVLRSALDQTCQNTTRIIVAQRIGTCLLYTSGKAGQFHHFPLASRSKSVVALSLAASAVNLWVATPGIVCTLHRVAAKFIPHCLMVPLMELFRRL